MVRIDKPLIADEKLEKNPAVDLQLVAEVYRMSKDLEDLGAWEETRSRVRSPFETRLDVKPHGLEMEQHIFQSR